MKNQKTKAAKAHPVLGEIDINVTSFGEIDGRLDIDKINKFLDKNVTDKKLAKDQLKDSQNMPDSWLIGLINWMYIQVMINVFDRAMLDYFENKSKGTLLIHNTYGEPDEMPLDVYFRLEDELSDLEINALLICKGRVLDIGAGLGSLSLILQERGVELDALEISETFCSIMEQRGVKNILRNDFMTGDLDRQYDTLLMMLNGFGLCGSFDRLPSLFQQLDKALAPNGQIIFDSSDLDYLYEGEVPTAKYYGEMDFQYEYNGKKGNWFKWLYIDSDSLAKVASENGFALEVLATDDADQYLGRLTRKE